MAAAKERGVQVMRVYADDLIAATEATRRIIESVQSELAGRAEAPRRSERGSALPGIVRRQGELLQSICQKMHAVRACLREKEATLAQLRAEIAKARAAKRIRHDREERG